MTAYEFLGTVSDQEGNPLEGIAITVQICGDTIEYKTLAKVLTYDAGPFHITESSWDKCETATLTFDDFDCTRAGGLFQSQSQVFQLEKNESGHNYDYYNQSISVVLTR